MRVFWEKVGMLGSVYRLAGQGFSDHDIAEKLNLAELSVQACIAWILHFLGFTDRNRLIRYAAAPTVMWSSYGDEQLLLRIATPLVV
jgi:hypothetical protein